METKTISFDQRLDTEFLEGLYEDDMDHALAVFSDYLKMVPLMMNDIDESYKSGIVESFRQQIHKVKPVFSFVGLTYLTEKAGILENYCKVVSHINDLSPLYKELQYHYFKDLPIIEKETKRLKN